MPCDNRRMLRNATRQLRKHIATAMIALLKMCCVTETGRVNIR